MEGKRLIQSIRLSNILSYGPDSEEFALEPLNVLIGPNASGKSNLISAISLLQAAPTDVLKPIREGGGIREWLWKGGGADADGEMVALVHKDMDEMAGGPYILRHCLILKHGIGGAVLAKELLEAQDTPDRLSYAGGRVAAMVSGRGSEREIDASSTESVLARFRAPGEFPEIGLLARDYHSIRVYADWDLGNGAEIRRPQHSSISGEFLDEDARNLALVVNALKNRVDTRRRIVDYLQRFCPRIEDVDTQQIDEYTRLNVFERGLRDPISATRLSDGTLRYLCLLSILCHPKPPPLVCIEEPELGLHPDIMPTLAELLLDASQRMQIIVTTHSSQLVSALSDVPESVVVAERADGGTLLRRLEPERMAKWLEDYTLGTLWMMGELGGNP